MSPRSSRAGAPWPSSRPSVRGPAAGPGRGASGGAGLVDLRPAGPRLRRRRGTVFAHRPPRHQDCAPHGTTVRQRQPRPAQRRGRRLPADRRLPQAGDARAPQGPRALSRLGIAGSFFLAVGILLLLIGILRLLQTETGRALTGDWSWVPYWWSVVLGIAVVGVAAWRITAGTRPSRSCPVGPPGTRRPDATDRIDRREQLMAATTTRQGATGGSSPGTICRPPTPR